MDKIDAIIENEKEWRREMYKEIKSLREDVNRLKVLASLVGLIMGYIGSNLKSITKFFIGHQ